MNNNQLVRDARIQSQGMAVDSLSFLPSLSPHLRSPFRVAEVKEESSDCEGGKNEGAAKQHDGNCRSRTEGARTVRTVLLVGMRTNGAAPLAGEGGEREKRHIDQPNASPSHAWLDAREIRRMCGES